MSYVLDQQKQQQVLGLGRLGWPVQRIAEATGVDRATARGYLLAAGIPVRSRGRPGERVAKPAIAVEVSTDSTLANPAICGTVSTDAASPAPTRAPSASACEPYRELIVEALRHGRNAVAIWQDLVDDHGFSARYASVRRFVLNCAARRPPRRASSSRPRPAKKARSITATAARWSATGARGSTAGHGSSS